MGRDFCEFFFQVVVLRVSLHCRGCEGKLRKHISRMAGMRMAFHSFIGLMPSSVAVPNFSTMCYFKENLD